MIKKYRKNKLKGSVLYTVVAVMMIMTVFVFAALTLASAANRRAFNSYANNQTQYTARSVVETVWEQIESIPEIGKKIDVLSKSGVGSELSFDEIKIPDSSMGEVTGAKVTYLGKGIDYGYDINDNFYKLSVTVKMLGQENTLAGYFLPERIENPSFEYALVSLDSGSLDNAAIYGGASYGVGDYGNNGTNNNTVLRSPIQMNGNLSIDQPNHIYIEQNSGFFINGNLSFGNDGNIKSLIDAGIQHDYRELPFLYIDQCLNYLDKNVIIGSNDNPVLIMADSVYWGGDTSKTSGLVGDIYLYGSNSSTVNLNGSETCGIKKWNENILKKKDNAKAGTLNSYTGGNLYSLGTVYVNGNNQNSYNGTLANNVVADTLIINRNVKTDGAVVAKNASIGSGNSYNFTKGLFTDPEKINCVDSSFINGVEYKKQKTVIGTYPISINIEQIWLANWGEHYITYNLTDAIDGYVTGMDAIPQSISVEWETDTETNSIGMYAELYVADGWGISSITGSPYTVTSGTSGELNVEFNTTNSMTEEDKLKIGFSAVNGNNAPIKIKSITLYVTLYSEQPDVNATTEFIKNVNDVAFNNNGNIIYIDDIDKSVKIEKFSDVDGYTKLKISKADLTGVDEGNEIGLSYTDIGEYYYDSQYADFLRAVVDTVTFPESMKKANVLKSNGGFVDDTFLKVNDSGKSEIKDYAEKEVINAFEHIGETENVIYDFNNNTITDKDNNIIGNISYPLTITSSCTFKNGLSGNGINISPSSENIYIKLDGFGVYNMQGRDAIIVNDNDGKNRVNFLIPKGNDVSITGNLLTEYYKNNTAIIQNPIKNDDLDPTKKVVDQQKIPGVAFYMEYDEDNMHKIEFPNSAHVSAYILAPSGSISISSSGIDAKQYSYNGIDCNIFSDAIIGGVVCKNPSLNNGCLFAYVNPNPKLDEDSEEELTYEPRCIYYQAY